MQIRPLVHTVMRALIDKIRFYNISQARILNTRRNWPGPGVSWIPRRAYSRNSSWALRTRLSPPP